jgi:hypothetical protein
MELGPAARSASRQAERKRAILTIDIEEVGPKSSKSSYRRWSENFETWKKFRPSPPPFLTSRFYIHCRTRQTMHRAMASRLAQCQLPSLH